MAREMTREQLLKVDGVKPWAYGRRNEILGAPGTNLVSVPTPQLAGLPPYKPSRVTCHQLVAPMFQRALELVEQLGLLGTFLTFDGCYNDRAVRGGSSASTHAFGAAFDFNYAWNQLGHKPAAAGEKGSLYPVIGVFEACGFGWGGWWNRADGMHFEPFEIRTGDALPVLVDHARPAVTATEAQRLAYQRLMHEHLKGMYTSVGDVLGDGEDAQAVTAALNGINRILVKAGVKDG